ncbi:MAG: hypothetical protein GX815_08740 [Clostridiales bacterium]|nr:hypothetical protein [Clostridiales bacterium]
MRIISIKRGFASDHSSTSYEFLAVDKVLNKKEKVEVAALSRRARPTSRRVSFVYHVDGYDIPSGWEELMDKYYDVMYREDYDWWTLALAFNTAQEQMVELKKYDFIGENDLGVSVDSKGKRVVIAIYCRINMAYALDTWDTYDEFEDEEGEEDGGGGVGFVVENELLNLLVQVRQQIIDRDYRALYAVWEKYGSIDYDDEFDVPVPPDKKIGSNIVKQFKNLLD